jgi:polysaccharide transporter, PST family
MIQGIQNILRNSGNFKKVAENTLWQVVDKVSRLVVQIVMRLLIARHLGPSSFGLLNYAIALVALFSPLATLGLDRLLIRDFVIDAAAHGKVMLNGLFLRAAGGIVIVPISCLLILVIRPGDYLLVALVAILSLVPIIQAFDVIDFWFQSRLDVRWVTFAKLFSLAIATAFRFGLLLWSHSVLLFASATLIESVFRSLALVFVYRPRRPLNSEWKLDFSYVGKLISQGWSLALSLIFYAIYLRIDQVMLGMMKGDAAVGIFSVATMFNEGLLTLVMLVSNSLFPVLVKLYTDQPSKFWIRYEQICLGYSIVGWIFTGVLWFGRYLLVQWCFGPKYFEAANVLGISSFALLFLTNAALRSSYLTLSNQQMMLFGGAVLGAVLNVAINLYCIPRWGVMGAAWATLISQAAALFFSNLFFSGTRRLFWIQARSLLVLPAWNRGFRQALSPL